MFKKIVLASLLAFSLLSASAQNSRDIVREAREKDVYTASGNLSRWCVSTNLVDWAWFGTINGEAQFSVSRRLSLDANAKYNNWTFKNDIITERMRTAQRTFAAGLRFWPWYVYSGWWVGAKAQYQEYSRGGLFKVLEKEEGNAFGLALSGGYSVQIKRWLDIDFGLGVWGGMTDYVLWQLDGASCPACGRRIDQGSKFFVLPNEVYVSIAFIF